MTKFVLGRVLAHVIALISASSTRLQGRGNQWCSGIIIGTCRAAVINEQGQVPAAWAGTNEPTFHQDAASGVQFRLRLYAGTLLPPPARPRRSAEVTFRKKVAAMLGKPG